MESIRAIDALENITDIVERALMADVINNPYTTAYRSARVLGNHGVFQAIPLLRELAQSSDYMLAGEAIVALAKLGDSAYREQIEKTILDTDNPRLKIMCVEAIGIYALPDSLPLLLDILRGADPPPYLRDEVALAMASILDTQSKYYPILVRLLSNGSLPLTLAMDEVESVYEYYMSVHGRKRGKKDSALASHAKNLHSVAAEYIRDSNGSSLSRWILELPDEIIHAAVQIILSETVLDDDFSKQNSLKLLIVHWAAHELRLWVNKLKGE